MVEAKLSPHRLAVRTSPFHGGNRGSNPLGDAIILNIILILLVQAFVLAFFLKKNALHRSYDRYTAADIYRYLYPIKRSKKESKTMKTCLTIFTLFGAFASLATAGQGIICRDDRRLENGPLYELILTPSAQGYSLQTQYVPSLNSTDIKVENWASGLNCRIDEKTPIALCVNAEGESVVSIEERRRVFFDSIAPDAKKKTAKHTDISLSEGHITKKTASFNVQDCSLFGGEA
jgi:hypothetical protein